MKTLRRVILEAKIDGIEINPNSRGGDALKFAADAKRSLKGFKRERGRRGRGGKPKGSGRAPGGGYTLNGQPITDPNLKSNVGGSRKWRKHEFARARNAVKTDPQTTLQTSNTAYPLTADRVHIHEVNIVKGKLEDGNGTEVRKSFQGSLTQKAIALRDAGKASRASKHSLAMAKRSQGRAAAMRPSKFDGPRIRTRLKKPARGKGRGDPLPDVQLGGTAAERAQKEVGDNPNIYR